MIARFERGIHIERPVDDVFHAWSDADTLRRWFAPMATTPPEIDIDFRVGGRYTIRMELGAGDVHLTQGEYREIVPGKRIVFSWHCDAFADRPTIVTVTFESLADGTLVTVVHEGFQSPEAEQGQTMGWTACMDRLKAFLEDG